MPRSVNIDYECKECEHEFDVEFTYSIPAQKFGPVEKSHPEEPAMVDPEECEYCGTKVDIGIAQDIADNYD